MTDSTRTKVNWMGFLPFRSFSRGATQDESPIERRAATELPADFESNLGVVNSETTIHAGHKSSDRSSTRPTIVHSTSEPLDTHHGAAFDLNQSDFLAENSSFSPERTNNDDTVRLRDSHPPQAEQLDSTPALAWRSAVPQSIAGIDTPLPHTALSPMSVRAGGSAHAPMDSRGSSPGVRNGALVPFPAVNGAPGDVHSEGGGNVARLDGDVAKTSGVTVPGPQGEGFLHDIMDMFIFRMLRRYFRVENTAESREVVIGAAQTSLADRVEEGLNSLEKDVPWFMDALEAVAAVHPFTQAAVLAFKAVRGMELTYQSNEKKIITIYISMRDTMTDLVKLRDVTVKETKRVRPGSRETIEGRMQVLCADIAEDIRNCAKACDMYMKKRIITKLINSGTWDEKLAEWIQKFDQHRNKFNFILNMHTAGAVNSVQESLEDMREEVRGLVKLFAKWIPQNQRELVGRIKQQGGFQAIKDSPKLWEEVKALENIDDSEGERASQMWNEHRTEQSTLTLEELKEELDEDWNKALERNSKTFDQKFKFLYDQLEQSFKEIAPAIREEVSKVGNRLVTELGKGPHDLITHAELKEMWKEMHWRRNVKARHFVMTLRDSYTDISRHIAAASGNSKKTSTLSDEWAFEYISITYLQPIMEAFDDDGSGYITVTEVNRFVNAVPQQIKWSLPHWIAYWAVGKRLLTMYSAGVFTIVVGWQLTVMDYCEQILDIFAHMFKMRFDVLPENRFCIEQYLETVWHVPFELCMSFKKPGKVPYWLPPKFQAYVDFEEKRIKGNLEGFKYNIDAVGTVYSVAGPGRIEKHTFTLIYLLLRRDIEIFQIAKSIVLHEDELRDAAASLVRIYSAIRRRYRDLKDLFTQQNLDASQQMKSYAYGMFACYSDNSSLFKMSVLADGSYDTPPSGRALVGQWDNNVQLLNYVKTNDSSECEVYEPTQQMSLVHDLPEVPMDWATSLIVGEWNGFVSNEQEYPAETVLLTFHAYSSSETDEDFKGAGISEGTTFMLSGTCSYDCDGNISVVFKVCYAEPDDTHYFAGHLSADGSIMGTRGENVNYSSHSFSFILRRPTVEIGCHHPSSNGFLESIPRPRDVPFYRSIIDGQQKIVPRHPLVFCDACGRFIRGARIICLDCQPPTLSYTETFDLCDDPRCCSKPVPRDDIQNDHTPNHDLLKTRTILQDRSHPDLDRSAKRALKECKIHYAELVPQEEGADSSSEVTQANKVDISGSPKGVQHNGDQNTSSSSSQSTRERLDCAICEKQILRPCWFCVDCFSKGESVFICDKCDNGRLLKCSTTDCNRLYKQPTWYYGERQEDFMCYRCSMNRVEPPDARAYRHSYVHSLVRCKRRKEPEIQKSVEERITVLEEKVSTIDRRLERLEDKVDQLLSLDGRMERLERALEDRWGMPPSRQRDMSGA